MIHLTDDTIDRALDGADLVNAMDGAFAALARGEASLQERIRTEAGAVKLSTMGGVWPEAGFVGAKVYTTIAGQFRFVIVLFSAKTGEPLATLEANALTRWRTAAVSALAARHGANAGASRLALFGTGVQAFAHARAFSTEFPLADVRVVSRANGEAFAIRLQSALGLPARAMDARSAIMDADLIVTTTRAASPLFAGGDVAPGAFVAAVGSSKPDTREVDDALLSRAASVVVEWKSQSLREAGDLVLASKDVLAKANVLELGAIAAGQARARSGAGDIVVFKSVGVGLEDVVTAGIAWQRATGA